MLQLVTVYWPAKAFIFYSGHPDVCTAIIIIIIIIMIIIIIIIIIITTIIIIIITILLLLLLLLLLKTLDRLQELLIASEHLSRKDCIWEIVIDTAIVFFKIYIILNVI